MNTLEEFSTFYREHGDVPETHLAVYDTFLASCHADAQLAEHRRHVEANGLGTGYPGFHHLWKLIVDALPTTFAMLEVGIHCGQIVSLVEMLARRTGRKASITGVSTFDGSGMGPGENDSWKCPGDGRDYRPIVLELFARYRLKVPHLVKGDSTDPAVVAEVRGRGPYDVVFIDGSHNYADVREDLGNYAPQVKVGGYLVCDDSSKRFRMPPSTPERHFFQGIDPVSKAVDGLLPPFSGTDLMPDGSRWEHLGPVLHDRIWRRKS